jgi:hypothetical protein
MLMLKNGKVILAIILVLTWLVGGVLGYFYYTSNVKKFSAKESEMLVLQGSLDQVGALVSAFTVVTNMKSGKVIEDTDLTPLQVPINLASTLILTKEDLIGKYYRVDLTPGTPISADVITTFELTDDLRLFDMVVDNIPVGLKVGSFIDIRISLPFGEDFIAIPHKQVRGLNAGVLKLAITEQDIHTYNSMLIDSLLYSGTQLYAVEYLEGGVQKAADAYYPISTNILSVAQKDPNLLTAIKSDILNRRTALETGLSQGTPTNSVPKDLDIIITQGKEKYSALLTDADRAYQQDLEKRTLADAQAKAQADAQAQANAQAAQNQTQATAKPPKK